MGTGFSFGIPGGAVSAGILAAAMVALVALGLRALRAEPRTTRRRVLYALRIATGLGAWAIAVQPRWLTQRFEERDGRLAVLVDASRSMGLPRDGEARQERARALLSRWADSERGGVSVFTFGERLEAADLERLAEEAPARADQSRLGAALAELVAGDDDLGAVVVVSDGADRSGFDPAGLARHGVRVHSVAVAEEGLRDDAIAEVQADAVGFLRRPARVRVVVRSLGGPGGPIPVTLRRDQEVVREVAVEVPANGEAAVEIPFTPERLGRAVYRVSVPRASGDAVPENDERAFLVRVVRDKLRVLLVAGQPSWDQRFLRAFLKRDPATDLISFFILRNTTDLTMAGPDELALIPFPTDELFNEHLGSFDLVIFQNFEYGPYQMASYLPRIREYVLRGGSFAMIGGPLSFHSGGYTDTPIADVLPVELPRRGASRTIAEGAFAPRLAEGMERHPLIELVPDPAQNAAAWGRLAELHGINRVTRVRPGAAVLLEHPSETTDERARHPVLVLGTAGEGRTLAFTTDTSWRWGITTGGLTGDPSAYERFWDRAVRWLSRDPTLEPARLTTDRERYGPGARVVVQGTLRDERYVPYAGEAIELVLLDAAGGEVARTTERLDREGRLEGALSLPDRPGAYRVEARRAGRDSGVAEEWLVVETGGDELADPRADAALLRRLAQATGGEHWARPEDAPALERIDATRRRSQGVDRTAPLSSPWAFVVVVGAFVAEWVLRRRWLGARG
ncbi:MAG: hypothetical protein KF729_15165 [Sandaracinaceae bacterium]|nr:hypothetical protein [Sandaracinaceae bacterium]